MGDARKGGWCEGVCVGRALCVAHHERAGEGGGLHSGDGEHCWSVFASFCVMKPDADALSGKHPFLAARVELGLYDCVGVWLPLCFHTV